LVVGGLDQEGVEGLGYCADLFCSLVSMLMPLLLLRYKYMNPQSVQDLFAPWRIRLYWRKYNWVRWMER
jgi:hypothetical protein